MVTRALEAWSRWWLDDLPPIGGRVRVVFYTGLLILTAAHHKSPIRGLAYHAATEPELVAADGLLALLGLRYIPTETLITVGAVTLTAWLCAHQVSLSSRGWPSGRQPNHVPLQRPRPRPAPRCSM